ncbi:hypothetical protein KIN20_024920 [Parelaphostrongylus tenuis]|uniref:Uncharacterized protein n=1 Tax=Parelaphostrongylus tenuis TaxID=148309 RepID=A0AAD5QWL1_PARTN|nr:hypothetical protein KIN20_024920 [Parelaphostrongylus tenuis]
MRSGFRELASERLARALQECEGSEMSLADSVISHFAFVCPQCDQVELFPHADLRVSTLHLLERAKCE